MKELPLPVTIGGSRSPGSRVTGPPNKVFPYVRDLAEACDKADITVQVDTMTERKVGVIRGLSRRPGSDESLYIQTPSERRSLIKMRNIQAIRVLKVEVEDDTPLPIKL